MSILQLIAEKEKSLCFDFLEEKIREESRKLIESIYADSNFNPKHLTIYLYNNVIFNTKILNNFVK